LVVSFFMPITQHQIIQVFLDYLKFQKRYSQHTIISYQNDLTNFFDFIDQQFGATVLPEIKPSFVRSWLAGLKEKQLQSKSINRKISSLKSFFKYQLKQGLLQTSPMATIYSAKVKKRLPQFVTENDISALLNHVEFSDDWNGRTNRLIFELLYATGMRRAELINLKPTHIDSRNCSIKVLGKGNKERILPVSSELIQLLLQYKNDKENNFEVPDEEILLVNEKGKKLYPKYIYNIVSKYLSQVTTISKKSPHVLRHTFATHLMNNGADINAVKELLGHSSLAATQIYTHNTIEKLKQVHNKAHPKG
jgi:integrase/recombinase XerC